jgi:GAF domain-containing protein
MASESSAASQLAGIAQSIAIATSVGSTDERLGALTPFLAQVREALRMEVAFVSQLLEDRRVFKVVSASRAGDSAVQVGHSDSLLDTYCLYVVQGRLPPVIRNIRSIAHEAALLPITQRLNIGCYVSAPVVLSSGQVFGTLCCFSSGERPDLMEADGQAVREVARAIAGAVERDSVVGPLRWAPRP